MSEPVTVDIPGLMWAAGCHVRVVRGTCMEPLIPDGSMIIIDPSRKPADGDVVVARIGNDPVLRILRRDPAIAEVILLAADQAQHDPIIIAPEDMQLEGTVSGVMTPASRFK